MYRIYEDKLYNEELKNRFLAQYPENTAKTYRNIFLKTNIIESQLNKDLYEFNLKEADGILYTLRANSEESLAVMLNVIAKYVDWCIQEGYVPTKINVFRMFGGDIDRLRRYISPIIQQNKYITIKEEFEKLLRYCENKQDEVIFVLLYEGVKGDDKLDEIRNLKIQDCDFETNTLKLTRNDGSIRYITVETHTMEVIKEAYQETEYRREGAHGEDSYMMLYPSDYVVKNIIKGSNSPQASYQTIRNRIKRVAELYGNPFLNANYIARSGMIHYARILMKQYNTKELTRDIIIAVNEKFGEPVDEQGIYRTKIRIQDYV